MDTFAETTGKIISAEVGVKQSVRSYSEHSSSLVDMYFPKVTYQYSVNGNTYENDRYWDEEISLGQMEKIEEIVARHSVGSSVTVYYDPQNPASSYLERLPDANLMKPMMILGGIGALIIIVIIVLLVI